MSGERKITRVKNFNTKWKLKVAVYCRVSTTHAEQLESLSSQIDYLKPLFSNILIGSLLRFIQISSLAKTLLAGRNSKECWKTVKKRKQNYPFR